MKKMLMLAAAMMTAVALYARTDGFLMFSVFSPGQLPAPLTSIHGARFSLIYGDCQSLNGIDLGLSGRAKEYVNGIQVSGLGIVGTDMIGLQIGLVNWVEGDFDGLQLGLWNECGDIGKGVQLGLVNCAGEMYGFQCGLFNRAKSLYGLQLGLVNCTGTVQNQNRFFMPLLMLGW